MHTSYRKESTYTITPIVSGMARPGRAICLCPLEGVIDIISKKWALLIVNEIGNHGQDIMI